MHVIQLIFSCITVISIQEIICTEIFSDRNKKYVFKVQSEPLDLKQNDRLVEKQDEYFTKSSPSIDTNTGQSLDIIKKENLDLISLVKEVSLKVDHLQGQLLNIKHENHALTKQLKKVFQYCNQQRQGKMSCIISGSTGKNIAYHFTSTLHIFLF